MTRSSDQSLATIIAAFIGSYLAFTGALAMIRDSALASGALLFALGIVLLIARTPTLARSADDADHRVGIRLAVFVAIIALATASIATLV